MLGSRVPLVDALRSLLTLVKEDGGDDDGDDDNGGDDDGNGGGVENDPTNTDYGGDWGGPVGTSTISLSDLIGDNDLGDTWGGGDWSDRDTDMPSGGAEPRQNQDPNFDSNPYSDPWLATANDVLSSQIMLGGIVRAGYETTVAGLDPTDSFARTLAKSIDRALTPPIPRTYLSLVRPEMGPTDTGITGGYWNEAINAENSSMGSANTSNLIANRLGAAGRIVGAVGLGISVINIAVESYQSSNPAEAAFVGLSRLGGNAATGYLAGYALETAIVGGVASLEIAAAAPLLVAGAATIAVGAGSILLAYYGGQAAAIIAEDLYSNLHPNHNH